MPGFHIDLHAQNQITPHSKWYTRCNKKVYEDNNFCNMDGDQVSELKEEAQVKFASIALWKLDKENKVEYIINPGVEISFEDWIGVYKVS